MIASSDLEQNEWPDPSVLERLAPAGRRITIDESAISTVDLIAVWSYR